MALLEIKSLTKTFGGLKALSEIDFSLDEGQIVSIIGPNGAGKTTFFNTLTGIYKPDKGSITFTGKSMVGLRPDKIASNGMSRTFQNIRLFPAMTVVENVLCGMHSTFKQTLFHALLRPSSFKEEERAAENRAVELLHYVGLKGVGNELAKNLPYGAQRRLEIARALAAHPKLLLLDEPAAGMNPQETEDITKLFRSIRDDMGITILLIEHDMRVVMEISEHIGVFDYGQKIAEGTPQQIRTNSKVIEAYLGRGAAEEVSKEVAA